jgi:hypothetical protein
VALRKHFRENSPKADLPKTHMRTYEVCLKVMLDDSDGPLSDAEINEAIFNMDVESTVVPIIDIEVMDYTEI